MYLHIDSDAMYLVLPKARSRGAGHIFLSDKPPTSNTKPTPTPNGAILIECKTLRNVMTSAAKRKHKWCSIVVEQQFPSEQH